MKRLYRVLPVLAMVFGGFGLARQAPAGMILPPPCTFDNGLDGWILSDPTMGTLVWKSSGGNDGGFAHYTDSKGGRGAIEAPASFLGDWSDLDGTGTLRYDHILISRGSGGSDESFWVTLTGPGGSAKFVDWQTPMTEWQTITVPINSSQWTLTGGTWAGLLADVTKLDIAIEIIDNPNNPNDVDGIDNIVLSNTEAPNIPEPSSLILLALGGLTLLRRRARRTPAQW